VIKREINMKGSGVGSGSTLFDLLARKEKATGRWSEILFSYLSLFRRAILPSNFHSSWGNRKGRERLTLHKKEGCGIPKTRPETWNASVLKGLEARGSSPYTWNQSFWHGAEFDWLLVREFVTEGMKANLDAIESFILGEQANLRWN